MPATKKDQLLERFDLARSHNAELISEIKEFVSVNKASDTPFMEGYTFKSVISTLEEERDLVFNDVNRMAVTQADENASELDYLIDKIENQINHYAEIKMGYIIAKGISANRITSQGYGETKHVAPNDTPENRQLNRRVEFTILKN